MKTKTRDEKMKKLNAEIETLRKKLYPINTASDKETEEQKFRRLREELENLEEKQAIEELQGVFEKYFGSAPSTSSEAWGTMVNDVYDDYNNLVKVGKRHAKTKNARWLVDFNDFWVPASDAKLLKYVEDDAVNLAIDIKTWKVYEVEDLVDIEYKLKPKFKK